MKWQTFMNSVHQFISPPVDTCLTCNKRVKQLNTSLAICEECTRTIPWIAKPRCGVCGRHIGCPDCTRPAAAQRAIVCNRSSVAYNAQMREWLAQYKYRGNERYAELLAKMLERAYTGMKREFTNTHFKWKIDFITFVPVSQVRLSERGFNQAEMLGSILSRKQRIPLIPLLERRRHTVKQSFKSRHERIQDMQGIFQLHSSAVQRMKDVLNSYSSSTSPLPLRILLVDDIYTTGSTVNACAHILKEAGLSLNMPLEVYCLTWARS
ncbi:ComF family protein [Paenibacillus sediminis]|uniref:ComF family protein n=1 Tax=Paenibacillus sediminis TaxID=664909 RepID=A0ABS4H323_9BACL|nr:ComF family protein [Paenibacillus sediminis]MBP1936667.1 ComF family protein [Paenibacillus sediminis]